MWKIREPSRGGADKRESPLERERDRESDFSPRRLYTEKENLLQ